MPQDLGKTGGTPLDRAMRKRQPPMTDQALADKLGKSQQHVNRLRRGIAEPSLKLGRKIIAEFPELTLDDLARPDDEAAA